LYPYSKLLPIIICILFLHFCPGQCTIEFREDFMGEGDLQTQADYNGVKGGVLTRGAESIYYGQVLTSAQNFQGLRAIGNQSSYYVATEDHSLRIHNSSDLNATAKILSSLDGENLTRTTFFSASGNGKVREKVLTPGKFSRSVEISSLWHSGKFKLNSTVVVGS